MKNNKINTMKINKKTLAVIILISIFVIVLTLMYNYNPIILYVFIGCIGMSWLLSWCLRVLMDEDE